MLVDANILLFAVSRTSPHHAPAVAWLTQALEGNRRVGLPWTSLVAFLRISTNPRVYERPLAPDAAMRLVRSWLDTSPAWVPEPTPDHAEVLAALLQTHHVTADVIADAHLAALALEHGLTVVSADTDFARFPEVRWENPLTAGS